MCDWHENLTANGLQSFSQDFGEIAQQLTHTHTHPKKNPKPTPKKTHNIKEGIFYFIAEVAMSITCYSPVISFPFSPCFFATLKQ